MDFARDELRVTFYFRTTGLTKKVAPKNFANFSRTIERKYIKFCSLVIHSVICKSEKFLHIIYRIDKINS